MASTSENDESSSNDTDDDSIFFDATSSLSNVETTPPLQQDPRRTLSSKSESLKRTEHFYTIPLTETQLHDIARRDKLQQLRAQEDNGSPNHQTVTTKPTSPTKPLPVPSASPSQEREFLHDETSAAPDLLKDHIDGQRVRRKKKNSKPISTPSPAQYQQQRSLPYPTLPVAKSARGTGGHHSSLSAISEPNIIDLDVIDRLTKFGELTPNSRKLNDEEILRQPIVHNLDLNRYVPLHDANPMTQTIMQRVHASGSILSLRHSSSMNISSLIRRNSADNNDNNHMNGTNNLETSSMRARRTSNDEEDDNESSSSETSSTKSSLTTAASITSSVTTKSKTAAARAASAIFQGSKRQLTKFMVKNWLRKGKKWPGISNEQNDAAEIDEEEEDGERLLINDGSNGDLKYKASRSLKEPPQFDKTQLLQTIVNAHNGPIWCMRFSPEGRLLATGGQDSLLKVWVLKSAQPYFNDFARMTSDSLKQQHEVLTRRFNDFHRTMSSETATTTINASLGLSEIQAPLYARPFCVLVGHQAPVLDMAWSKSLFLLSSSMDKTVRLWHLSREECLCFFRHVDFVSAIAFHPRDDRYFVSASLDGHVRLWNIPDKRVVYWSLIPTQPSSQAPAIQGNLITAVNFCDDGRKVTVGTFDGRFLLYTDSLQYDTVTNIGDKDGSRSHRSRKKRRKPHKITGIEPMNSNNSKVLITSNDSRIRLYDIRSKEIERKYRGYSNQSSQIRASFSHDDRYIISGSEDSWFYVWRTEPSSMLNTNGTASSSASSASAKLTRKQRRHFDRAFERVRVHNTMVTSAIFAPNPSTIMDYLYSFSSSSNSPASNDSYSSSMTRSSPSTLMAPSSTPTVSNNNRPRLICVHAAPSPIEAPVIPTGPLYVMVTADSKGQLKLLVNRFQK